MINFSALSFYSGNESYTDSKQLVDGKEYNNCFRVTDKVSHEKFLLSVAFLH